MVELLIIVLVVLWLLGYFGRGRVYGRGGGEGGDSGAWYGGSVVHTLLVIAVILIILRVLRLL